MSYVSNKVADQPAHPRSLISTFVVHCQDSIIPIAVIAIFPRLLLASIAEQAGLSLTWSIAHEYRFSLDMAHFCIAGSSNEFTRVGV